MNSVGTVSCVWVEERERHSWLWCVTDLHELGLVELLVPSIIPFARIGPETSSIVDIRVEKETAVFHSVIRAMLPMHHALGTVGVLGCLW